MRTWWLRLLPLASVVAVTLLVVGFVGWGVLFEMEEGVADPASASHGWRAAAVAVFHVLTVPLAAPVWAVGEAAGADGDGVWLLGFTGVVVDAWLYGYALAASVAWARARPVRRAV